MLFKELPSGMSYHALEGELNISHQQYVLN
jgi:hypothetical protein